MRASRIAARIFIVACVALSVLVMPAGAHGGPASIAVIGTPDANDPSIVVYRARLTYTEDDHPAEGATVVFQAEGSGSNALFAPIQMTEVDEGEYEVTETFPGPGTYNVTVSSADPPATFEDTYTVPASETTSTTYGCGGEDAAALDGCALGDDDPTISWPIVIGMLVFLAFIGTMIFVAVRRRR